MTKKQFFPFLLKFSLHFLQDLKYHVGDYILSAFHVFHFKMFKRLNFVCSMISQVEQVRQPDPEEEQVSPTKKTFLRKGSGLVRFGGIGAPPKRMRRSRSQVLPRTRWLGESIEILQHFRIKKTKKLFSYDKTNSLFCQ